MTTSRGQLFAWPALCWLGYAAAVAWPDRNAQFVVAFLFMPVVVARIGQAVARRRTLSPATPEATSL